MAGVVFIGESEKVSRTRGVVATLKTPKVMHEVAVKIYLTRVITAQKEKETLVSM